MASRALAPQGLPDLSLPDPGPAAGPVEEPAGESLLAQLARALHSHQVKYCQWKGHWSAHRWGRGYGDVDLLVDHADITVFRAVAARLGFKLALPAGERQIPAVEHYIGYDPLVPRLLHLHVHYRLVLGEYWKRVYRIPIERQILDHSLPGQPFRTPSPTHSFLIFVLRMMLRQVGRPLLSAQDRWLSGIQVPLAAAEAAAEREELARLLEQHLPAIDLPFFDRCVRSLEGQSGRIDRFMLPWQLHLRLRPHMRRPSVTSMVTAALEKILPAVLAGHLTDSRLRPSGGGLVVALIGGDGSGKSTCARELHDWLDPAVPAMRAHLGNPPKSLLTFATGGALKLQRAVEGWLKRPAKPGTQLELLRHVCTARDRYRLYQKARRFAVSGGVAVCERYPVPPHFVHVEPAIPKLLTRNPGWLARRLRQAEAAYYKTMVEPDVLLVLKLDPQLAVVRKPEEPAEYVRTRGQAIWETDWSATRAQVVDASQDLPHVLRQLKATIWSIL